MLRRDTLENQKVAVLLPMSLYNLIKKRQEQLQQEFVGGKVTISDSIRDLCRRGWNSLNLAIDPEEIPIPKEDEDANAEG